MKRYMVIMYNAEKKAPTTRAKSPSKIAIDPAKANSTIIIRYGMKYLSDFRSEFMKSYSELTGLNRI